MIGVLVVSQARGRVNCGCSARQRNKSLGQRLPIHQGQFTAIWPIDNLLIARPRMSTVDAAARLLHQPAHGIIALHHVVYACGPALCVPTVLMTACRIRRQVAVVVVAVAGIVNSVGGLIVIDLEGRAGAALWNSLGDIAKGIVAEVLLPDVGWTVRAIHTGNAPQVVMGVIAGLRVDASRNIVRGLQLVEAAVGIPGQLAYIGLRRAAHVKGIVRRAARVGVVAELVRIQRPKIYLCQRANGL